MTSLLKEIWLNSTHLYILLAVWLTQQGLLGLRELSFILHFCYESGLKIFVLVLFLPYLSLKCPFILKNALQYCTVYNGCLFEGIVPAGENWRTFCLVTPLGGMPGRSEGSAELYSWQMGEVYPHTMSELSSNHTPTFSYLLCQQGRKAVSFHFLHFLLSVPSLIMVNQQQVYYPQRPPSSNFFFFGGGEVTSNDVNNIFRVWQPSNLNSPLSIFQIFLLCPHCPTDFITYHSTVMKAHGCLLFILWCFPCPLSHIIIYLYTSWFIPIFCYIQHDFV